MSYLRYFTDDELLQELGNVRHQSPVIGELCRRLALAIEPAETEPLKCPVCHASLAYVYDDVLDTLTLKAPK